MSTGSQSDEPINQPNHDLLKNLQSDLNQWEHKGLTRTLYPVQAATSTHIQIAGKNHLNFASNDYLGLARHPHVIEATAKALTTYGLGSTASHAVCGHFEVHEALEYRFAQWVNPSISHSTDVSQACLFSSGYQANLAIISTLLGHHDAIFGDKLNHACLNDGAHLSRAAFHRFKHNDLDHLSYLLERHPAPQRMIAVDGVYSMDGDLAPLEALLNIAERHNTWLLVDDAHGIGVLGEGHGSLKHWGIQSDRLIYMGTLSKALGSYGACVSAHPLVIRTLIQRARPYLYTTAQPPAIAAGTLAAFDILEREPERMTHLQALSTHFKQTMSQSQSGGLWSLAPSMTAIQPLIIYTTTRAMQINQSLKELGFWVPAIRTPTVPENAARLRITFSAAHSFEHIDALSQALQHCLETYTSSVIKQPESYDYGI